MIRTRKVIKKCTAKKLIEMLEKYPVDTPVMIADEVIDSSDDRVIIIYDGKDLDIYSEFDEKLQYKYY